MREVVLLFNFQDKSQVDAIKMSLYLVKLPVEIVPKEKYGLPLKDLAKDENAALPPEAEPGPELEGQMMVFVGLLEKKLNKAISLIRENPNCGKIPYKAILTKTNQKWDAYTLFEELKKERAAMRKKKQAVQKQQENG